jgi:hypothetical protein
MIAHEMAHRARVLTFRNISGARVEINHRGGGFS